MFPLKFLPEFTYLLCFSPLEYLSSLSFTFPVPSFPSFKAQFKSHIFHTVIPIWAATPVTPLLWMLSGSSVTSVLMKNRVTCAYSGPGTMLGEGSFKGCRKPFVKLSLLWWSMRSWLKMININIFQQYMPAGLFTHKPLCDMLEWPVSLIWQYLQKCTSETGLEQTPSWGLVT